MLWLQKLKRKLQQKKWQRERVPVEETEISLS